MKPELGKWYYVTRTDHSNGNAVIGKCVSACLSHIVITSPWGLVLVHVDQIISEGKPTIWQRLVSSRA